MKKLAIAAALSALATTVSAQSVEVYGVIDTGFQVHDNGSSYSRAADSGLATSRLGFRGSEDLGNGLKVNFQIEGQLNPSAGSMGSTTTVATNEIFNREAWVGISSKYLGEIRVGKQDVTLAQDVDTRTSQFGNFGFRPVNGTAIELGVDQKNVIKYTTPTVGGFFAQVGFASANNTGATTDAPGDQKGAFVGYDDGRLAVFAGYQKNDATATAGERDFSTVGARYDLGYATVGLNYGEGDVNNANGRKNKTVQGSVRVPLVSGWAAHAVVAQAEDASQITDNKGLGYTVGVTKSFSKRTSIYAAYTAVDNDTNSGMYMVGQASAPIAGTDTKTYTVGISHSF